MWPFNLQPFLKVENAGFPTLQLRGRFWLQGHKVHFVSVISDCWYGERKQTESVNHIVLETKPVCLKAITIVPQKNIAGLEIPISETEMLIWNYFLHFLIDGSVCQQQVEFIALKN